MKTVITTSSLARSRYLEGLLLGICLSCFLLLLIFVTVQTEIKDPLRGHLPELLAGLGTVFAAYLALKGISAQIQSNLEIETIRRQSQLEAARASLPLALSELIGVCRKAMMFTYYTDRNAVGAIEAAKEFTMPDHALGILKECICYSDVAASSRLANIIRHYQVVFSRTLSSFENPGVGQMRYTHVFDWALVQLLLEDCFEFARSSSDTIPVKISERSFYSTFFRMDGSDFFANPSFMEEVNRRDQLGDFEISWDRS